MGRKTKASRTAGTVVMNGIQSGDATIVIAELGGLSASGTAKRGPEDRHYSEIGDILAQARALEGLARKLRREIKDFL